jgi:hypothetical protein
MGKLNSNLTTKITPRRRIKASDKRALDLDNFHSSVNSQEYESFNSKKLKKSSTAY